MMHALTSWFIRNPVAANLIMGSILIWGALSLWDIRIEGFPRVPPDTVSVSVVYPGATAEQVDDAVTDRIAEAVTGIPGARRISSYASEGYGEVNIQSRGGYSLDRLIENVRTRVDSVANLPAQAERPQVTRQEFDFPAMIVQIYGDTDQNTLQRLGRQLREDLLSQPEITQIRNWGERRTDLIITPDIGRLQSLGMNMADLAAKVQSESVLYRTGELRTPGGRLELRADERLHAIEQLRQMILISSKSGANVRLGDIATIKRGFDDGDFDVRFQGLPTLGYEIQIGQSDNILDVRRAVDRVVAEQMDALPENVRLEVWADQSSYISQRLSLLRDNALQGLLIVFVLLSIFLAPKLAFWVSLGIPISIAGAIGLMRWPAFDYSLNDVTTFGMIIALGILVDDAIVVGESVYEERMGAKNPIKATERGVRKVATATIFGVLTTVAAFSPMLMIQNPLGKVLAGFAAVVIFALLFSLFESKFILPAHLAETKIESGGTPRNRFAQYFAKLQDKVSSGLNFIRDRYYAPLIERAIHYRYAVVLGFVAIAIFVIGLMATGAIRTTFFPQIPGSYATVSVEMDRAASYKLAQTNANAIKEAYHRSNAKFTSDPDVDDDPARKLMVAVLGPQQIQIYAEMAPEAERDVETLEFLDVWRDETGALEGAEDIQFSATDEIGGGFAIELTSRNSEALADGVRRVKDALAKFDGVNNIRDDLAGARPQIRLRLNSQGRLLGLSTSELAHMVGDQYGGFEVERFLQDSREVRMIVRRENVDRASLTDLNQARIRLPDGQFVALTTIADFVPGYAPDEIRRRDLKRAALVQAQIDKSVTNAPAVFQALEPEFEELRATWPELEIAQEGELEEEANIQRDLLRALVISLMLIFVLLAIPLKSYWKPFVIMSVIPFGIVGAAFGHMLMDLPLSMLSFFGILALSGIVVNDSLVLLTRYNDLRSDGLETAEALKEAGRSRLRAIMLTTITTVAGLTPLLLETSEQAQYLIPAAVSLAFGEIFATLITLFLVPCLAAIGIDIFGETIRPETEDEDIVTDAVETGLPAT